MYENNELLEQWWCGSGSFDITSHAIVIAAFRITGQIILYKKS